MATTTRTSPIHEAAAARGRVRTVGLICIGAGVLGGVSGLTLALVEPVVDVERFSYPLSPESYVVAQLWFAIQHLGLLAGLLGLRWIGVLPDTRPARWGWWAAVLGMVGLTVTELIAIAAADAAVDSGLGVALGAMYGITCLALGVGLLAAGLSIWRARTWGGWRRGVVLLMGVWVFVPMFPALALTPTDGARLAIGGWMLLFAALGVALVRPGGAAGSERRA